MMSEAEYVYKIVLLEQRIRDNPRSCDVYNKCTTQMSMLAYGLYYKYKKFYSDYTDKQKEDLIAEHILLGE